MLITIFMNMSADGYIARNDDSVPFVSDSDWEIYYKESHDSDAAIVGRKTYDEMIKVSELDHMGNPFTVVMTRTKNLTSNDSNIVFSNETPNKVIQRLKNEGKNRVLICGGPEVNAAFLKAGLVNKIKISIAPTFIGSGIPYLNTPDLSTDLRLEDVQKIKGGSVILTYKVQ